MVLRQTRKTLTSLLSNAANADDAICVLPSSQALRLSPQNPPTLTRLCCADDHHAGTVPVVAQGVMLRRPRRTHSHHLPLFCRHVPSVCSKAAGSGVIADMTYPASYGQVCADKPMGLRGLLLRYSQDTVRWKFHWKDHALRRSCQGSDVQQV